MTLAERSRLAALHVPKRRADWLLGRLTAKRVTAAALRQALGGDWPAGCLEIAAEPGGAPFASLAPEAAPAGGLAPGSRLPVAVSISHHDGHALCAAAFTGAGACRRALGIDLGRVEPRSPGLLATFFTGEEQRWVAAAPPGDRDLRANLIWCAKEAVLKVLGLGLTVDTLALSCLPDGAEADPIEWPLSPPEGTWRRLHVECTTLLPGGGAIEGVWRTWGGLVGALARLDAPR